MKHTKILQCIFILLILIAGLNYILSFDYKNHYDNHVEPFTSKTIILLGDSILKNNEYVSNDMSVESILRKIYNGSVYCLAQNNTYLTDVYEQIDNMSSSWNDETTNIFLSVGGNDVLNHGDRGDEENNMFMNKLFSKYKLLVDTIKNKMSHSNVVLIDIYYPQNAIFKPYHKIIDEWNDNIYNYANNANIGVLRISKLLVNSSDFVYEIEPSNIGGDKIARAIVKYDPQ